MGIPDMIGEVLPAGKMVYKFIVHIERPGGNKSTYTQNCFTILQAIELSEAEHERMFGSRGTPCFAELQR